MTLAESRQPEALLDRFGLRAFRPGQRDVIDAVLAGHDALCVMPTGGGKSLCYQLPALALGGVTLVVSPLIALMKDQVDQLQALGVRATLINSTLTPAEQNARLDGLRQGAYELVYVVPERFRSSRFVEAVQHASLRLLAIDEAHCISEWGHDFRPDYARLGRYRQQLGNPPTIALTATATSDVRDDIIKQLDLRDPSIFITGFARPNLHYAVAHPHSASRKDEELLEFLRDRTGSGIIYASTRKRCEEVAEMIVKRLRRTTAVYHAGMTNEDRHRSQDAFMGGEAPLVVATTAFGMGIDKADVRFVVHYNLPGTLEGYYQEAGRAGRDGLPSDCLLLFSQGDRRIQEFFIESAYPARDVVAEVYNFLRSLDEDPIELTQHEIKDSLQLSISAEGVGTCEQLLEKAGVLERLESQQNLAQVRIESDLPTLVDLLPKQSRTQRRVLQAIESMVGPRRHETVYLHPRELAEATELDPQSLSRALRELSELKSFDYVPPFRGRAVHMRERKLPFRELNLDFEGLERRKAAEYEKLRRVIDFAQSRQCREQVVLDYFGDPHSAPCGRCDNCRAKGLAPTTPHVTDGRPQGIDDAVRMALAGVARMRSRFGKQLIAQMLCGSSSAKITRFGLQRLSTYGLFKNLKQDDVGELLTAMTDVGYLESLDGATGRPKLQLSDRGRDVMIGRESVAVLRLEERLIAVLRRIKAPAEAAPPAPVEAPPQRVEPPHEPLPERNPTPASVDTLPATPASPALEPSRPATGEVKPTHYWTWRLLSSGFTVEECSIIRGLEREVVLDHALRAIDQQWPIEIGWFLKPEQIAELDTTIGPSEPQRIRPLLAQLSSGLRYEDVQLYIKCRRAKAVTAAE